MVQSLKFASLTSRMPPVHPHHEISINSGENLRPTRSSLSLETPIWEYRKNNQSFWNRRELRCKSKLPLQRFMPRFRDAVQQYVCADLAACHGPCNLTRTAEWSEDLTSNGHPGDIRGEQGPRQTGALIWLLRR